MLNQVDTSTTIIGLVFFFCVFVGVIAYVYNPKKKRDMQSYGEIPLEESENKEV